MPAHRRAGAPAPDRDLHARRGDRRASPARCSRRRRSSSGLDVLGFPRSAELMIMLVLGGTGRLYGAIVGTAVFMIAQDFLSDINPVYWQFWLGLLLVASCCSRAAASWARRDSQRAAIRAEAGSAPMSAALRTAGLTKQFGEFTANSDVDLALARRRAPRAHRPQRRGQDHAHQPAHRRARADRGRRVPGDERITGCRSTSACKRGMTRTFQINTLFPGLTVLESVVLAICEREGPGWHCVAARRRGTRGDRRGARAARALLQPRRRRRHADAQSRLRPQRLVEIALRSPRRPRILLLDEPAAGIPRERERRGLRRRSRRCPPTSRSCSSSTTWSSCSASPSASPCWSAAQVLTRGHARRRSPPTRACARSISARPQHG